MPTSLLDAGPSGGSFTAPTFAAPAVTPAADYTPYNSAIPGAGIYAEAAAMANRAYDNALAQINKNRLNTLTDYGYKGTVDPTTGVVGGVVVDPNSVYGKLQQLLHGEAVQDEGALFQAEDRGLVGGLANQAQSQLRYDHGAQDTQLGNDLQSAFDALNQQQQSAAEARNEALWQAELAQLQAAIAAGAYNPPSDSSPPPAPSDPNAGQPTGYRDNNPGGVSWTRPPTAKTKAQRKILGRI